MTGNLKVLGVSSDNFPLKEKRTYKNVNIHFRDLHNHTVKLSNGKSFVLSISALSIESDSLLMEGDGFKGEYSTDAVNTLPVMLELRFYPKIEKHTSSKTN